MITSFRRLFLAVLIGSGFLFSGTIVMPQAAVAQEQEKVTPKKKTNKKSSKKTKKAKKTTKKSNKEQSAAQKG